jgi:hypothetical protein
MFLLEYDHGSWKNHTFVRCSICDMLMYLEALFIHGQALA